MISLYSVFNSPDKLAVTPWPGDGCEDEAMCVTLFQSHENGAWRDGSGCNLSMWEAEAGGSSKVPGWPGQHRDRLA